MRDVDTGYLYLIRHDFLSWDSRGGAAISTALVVDPIGCGFRAQTYSILSFGVTSFP